MKNEVPQIVLSEVTGEAYISYKGGLVPVTKEIVYAVYRSEKAMQMLTKILDKNCIKKILEAQNER